MEFSVKTSKREEVIDITEKVEENVSKLWEKEKKIVCNKKSRACLIFALHTTCAVIINEISNKKFCEDLLNFLKKQVPQGVWKHNCTRKNGDSHIKETILGSNQLIPISEGKLVLGTWQRIGLVELDGPRERKIIVQII